MNSTLTQSRDTFAPTLIPRAVWWLAIAACVLSGLAGLYNAWYYVFVPVILLAGLLLIVQPVWGLYALCLSIFFPYILTSEFNLYPADVVAFGLIAGAWLQQVRLGKSGFVRTPVDWSVGIWFSVMALSLINALDLSRGIVNLFRHAQLLLLMYAVATLDLRKHLQRIPIVLAVAAGTLALPNIVQFILAGGAERVFGIARIGLSGTITLAAVYVLTQLLLARNRRGVTFYAILFIVLILGQFANQSRAAIGTIGLGSILTLIVINLWARRNANLLVRKRVRSFSLISIIAALLVFILAFPVLQGMIDRFAGVGNAGTTMRLRYFLWETAIETFRQHPVLGIGLGQVQVWQNIFPSLRLDPIGPHTFGLGSHLAFFKYLPETGFLGIIPMLAFIIISFRVAWQLITQSQSMADLRLVSGFGLMICTLLLRVFIEGHFFYGIMGITNATFLGILFNLRRMQQSGASFGPSGIHS